MEACQLTQEVQEQQREEIAKLRAALRKMHAMARKYLALTGGGLSDGSEAAALARAAALLGIKE